ncbi:MAG: hypothetical protein KDA80_17485 [Planctomycetaceae bacterium]|nr:hypothetical protein [Planctomycetaceae bacterium]
MGQQRIRQQRWFSLGVAGAFLVGVSLSANAATRLVFTGQPDVSVRTTGGSVVRGNLLSLDHEHVRLIVPARDEPNGQREESLDTDAILLISTFDRSFQFNARSETVDAAIARGARIQGVESEHYTVPRSMPATTPDPAKTSEDPAPALETPLVEKPETQPEADSSAMTKTSRIGAFTFTEKEPDPNQPEEKPKPKGKVTLTCSNCMKEVSVDSEYGQKCPHCGIEWYFDSEPDPEPANLERPRNVPEPDNFNISPDGATAGNRKAAPAGNQAAPVNPGGPVQLAVPPPPPVNGGVPQEMTLATVPTWMKAALFVVALGGLYYVLFYVR